MVLGKIGGIFLIFLVSIFVVAFMSQDYSNEKTIIETTTRETTITQTIPSTKNTVDTSSDGTVLSNVTETITEIREHPTIKEIEIREYPAKEPEIQKGTSLFNDRPKYNQDQIELKIHELINQERKNYGLTQLKWDDKLTSIATGHSFDMAQRNYYSHNSPEGSSFENRYTKAGYNCLVPISTVGTTTTYSTGGENIQKMSTYSSYYEMAGIVTEYVWYTQEEIAENAVTGWMNSPGHKENILTSHFKSEGLGVAITPDNQVYLTQNFC